MVSQHGYSKILGKLPLLVVGSIIWVNFGHLGDDLPLHRECRVRTLSTELEIEALSRHAFFPYGRQLEDLWAGRHISWKMGSTARHALTIPTEFIGKMGSYPSGYPQILQGQNIPLCPAWGWCKWWSHLLPTFKMMRTFVKI